MKDSEIYLMAAKECSVPGAWFESYCSDEYVFACDALNHAAGWHLKAEFREYFEPKSGHYSWFGSTEGAHGAHNSHYRVLALCFMAALAKSEGR